MGIYGPSGLSQRGSQARNLLCKPTRPLKREQLPAGVLEAQDLGEAQVGVRRAVGRFRMIRLDGEAGVVAGQEVLQHRRGLIHGPGVGQTQFGYQPVLEARLYAIQAA